MNHLRTLQASRVKRLAEMRALLNVASADSRDLTAEESTNYEAMKATLAGLDAQIERETLLAEAERTAPAIVGTANDKLPRVEGMRSMLEDDGKRGFKHFGEFARAVQQAGNNFDSPGDERLRIGAAAPGTAGSEYDGSSGGFIVPPVFSQDVLIHSLQEGNLLSLCDAYEIESNAMVFPKDETTPWGTDGIRAYWQAEAAAATATKPKLGVTTLRLNKLMALVPVSDELLAETNALGQYLPRKVGDSIRWKTNEALLWGGGNGTPQGVLQSNALVTQAKEGGQATLTLNLANVSKMYGRMLPNSIGRAVWLINNDVIQALFQITLGNMPMFLPTGGAQPGVVGIPPGQTGTALNTPGSMVGLLFGRPVYLSQHMSTFSSLGDIAFVDFGYVRAITKAGGPQVASSMHLYFDADATAFRTTYRLDAQPSIVNPVNPGKGSNTLSPFVTLQAR